MHYFKEVHGSNPQTTITRRSEARPHDIRSSSPTLHLHLFSVHRGQSICSIHRRNANDKHSKQPQVCNAGGGGGGSMPHATWMCVPVVYMYVRAGIPRRVMEIRT